MRNPLWILNTGLALVFFITLGLSFFTTKKPLGRRSLKPTLVTMPPKKTLSLVDVRRIYENDPFKTYQEPLITPGGEEEKITIPLPPVPKMAPRLQPPQVRFLDPLKISVKGIITSSDQQGNRVIIADEKTKKEDLYKVGDTVEDAEIIRISSNKVIFLRSNGQEEVVFISAAQAAADPVFESPTSWNDIVMKTGSLSYSIDPDLFTSRIHNVAQLIDMLDITTALVDDKPIGCRVGIMPSDSLGHVLGLQQDDVILSINDMPLALTKERVRIYQYLRSIEPGAEIAVNVQRRGTRHTIVITLQSKEDQKNENRQSVKPNAVTINDLMLKKNNEIARDMLTRTIEPPSYMNNIIQKDRALMNNYGGQAAALQRTPINASKEVVKPL